MLKRICYRCGKVKRVDEFDLTGYKIKENRVFSQCKKCASKRIRIRKEDGRGYVTFGGGDRWVVPEQWVRINRKWGQL